MAKLQLTFVDRLGARSYSFGRFDKWVFQPTKIGLRAMNNQAVIFGATGVVGRQLLDLCLSGDKYEKVIVIARRPANVIHAKLSWIESEFDALNDLAPILGLADGDAYCCLGTTIKAAGSKEKFHQVDYDYVVNAARFAKICNVKNFSMVSAVGADTASRSFYNQTKGEVETAVIEENLPCLRIFRPSLLKGKRAEFRLVEEIGNFLSLLMTPLFYLGLRKYQPIEIEKLARAIYQTTADESISDSVRVYESDELQTY
jgi:uncharacterized protein YbjT (DUF2867 family)